jgi:hypothetical protein
LIQFPGLFATSFSPVAFLWCSHAPSYRFSPSVS